MNEQVDNALGGHEFATVTSTQEPALNGPYATTGELAKLLGSNNPSRDERGLNAIIRREEIREVTSTQVKTHTQHHEANAGTVISLASEPLYTRDELVEIASAAMYERYKGFFLENTNKDAWREDMQEVVNALLATGQLKERDEK